MSDIAAGISNIAAGISDIAAEISYFVDNIMQFLKSVIQTESLSCLKTVDLLSTSVEGCLHIVQFITLTTLEYLYINHGDQSGFFNLKSSQMS